MCACASELMSGSACPCARLSMQCVNACHSLPRSCHQVFFDLGHGTGRAVVAAALLHGHHFSRCEGVELLQELDAASQEVLANYKQVVVTFFSIISRRSP